MGGSILFYLKAYIYPYKDNLISGKVYMYLSLSLSLSHPLIFNPGRDKKGRKEGRTFCKKY